MIFSTRKKVLGVLILKGKENIHFPMKWLENEILSKLVSFSSMVCQTLDDPSNGMDFI